MNAFWSQGTEAQQLVGNLVPSATASCAELSREPFTHLWVIPANYSFWKPLCWMCKNNCRPYTSRIYKPPILGNNYATSEAFFLKTIHGHFLCLFPSSSPETSGNKFSKFRLNMKARNIPILSPPLQVTIGVLAAGYSEELSQQYCVRVRVSWTLTEGQACLAGNEFHRLEMSFTVYRWILSSTMSMCWK